MTPERWGRIKEIFTEALERDEASRDAFLAEECGSDAELRQQVERLLKDHQDTTLFDSPAQELTMIGRTISHYKILDKLGAGGMGVVYRAEDEILHRPVALKFLRPGAMEDQRSRGRFSKEAETAAILDHPNITTVYEIGEAEGQTFIAMALIEGESLAEKISQRPLPLVEALRIASEVGEALDAAHEKGVVHRDIKPSNIMVTPDGRVKVMDFGLAQFTGQTRITKTGAVVGTPVYMSPEQLQGNPVDRRTDIWALGVVLYEMLTQRTPFAAEQEQAVAHAILNEEPEPVSAQRADVQPDVDRILSKALAKDLTERYQNVADLIVDFRSSRKARGAVGSTTSRTLRVAQGTPHRAVSIVTVVAVLSVLAAVAFAVLWLRSPVAEGPGPPRRFTVKLSQGALWPVISPSGRYIAYFTRPSPETAAVWVHDLVQDEARAVLGPDGKVRVAMPFWSPNGETLVVRSGDELRKLPLDGGPAATLCSFRGVGPFGGSWSPDGDWIVFSGYTGLWQVPAEGGEPTRWLEWSRDERIQYGWPHFLPSDAGERKLLFVEIDENRDGRIIAHDLRTGKQEKLLSGTMPVYSPTGHILRRRDPAEIWAVPFSIDTMKLTGEAFPVSENASRISVDKDGTLVYIEGDARVPWLGLEQLAWRDREENT